jgi:hypothetical protein
MRQISAGAAGRVLERPDARSGRHRLQIAQEKRADLAPLAALVAQTGVMLRGRHPSHQMMEQKLERDRAGRRLAIVTVPAPQPLDEVVLVDVRRLELRCEGACQGRGVGGAGIGLQLLDLREPDRAASGEQLQESPQP